MMHDVISLSFQTKLNIRFIKNNILSELEPMKETSRSCEDDQFEFANEIENPISLSENHLLLQLICFSKNELTIQ